MEATRWDLRPREAISRGGARAFLLGRGFSNSPSQPKSASDVPLQIVRKQMKKEQLNIDATTTKGKGLNESSKSRDFSSAAGCGFGDRQRKYSDSRGGRGDVLGDGRNNESGQDVRGSNADEDGGAATGGTLGHKRKGSRVRFRFIHVERLANMPTTKQLSPMTLTVTCSVILGIGFNWVPVYWVVTPTVLLIAICMLASLPMLLAYVLIDSRKVTHWVCVGCTFAAVWIHPIWIDAFDAGHAGPTPDSDGVVFERPSFEEKQRWRRDLIQSAMRGDRDYKKQTENGLALSVLLKSESNWLMRQTQPGLFWLFPPSIALVLVGATVLLFGGKPNGGNIAVKKAGTHEL